MKIDTKFLCSQNRMFIDFYSKHNIKIHIATFISLSTRQNFLELINFLLIASLILIVTYFQTWREEIIPNFKSFFDYKKLKPKSFLELIKKSKAIKFKPKKPNLLRNSLNFLISSKKRIHNFNDEEFSKDDFFGGHEGCLLLKLWKMGIPSFVRKTLWPIVIPNRLEVSHYNIIMDLIWCQKGVNFDYSCYFLNFSSFWYRKCVHIYFLS